MVFKFISSQCGYINKLKVIQMIAKSSVKRILENDIHDWRSFFVMAYFANVVLVIFDLVQLTVI